MIRYHKEKEQIIYANSVDDILNGVNCLKIYFDKDKAIVSEGIEIDKTTIVKTTGENINYCIFLWAEEVSIALSKSETKLTVEDIDKIIIDLLNTKDKEFLDKIKDIEDNVVKL